MIVHLPVDHPTATEAVAYARPFDGAGVGFAIGPRLLVRGGVAVVTMLRAFGPVLADARLSGDAAGVIGAARVLASGGASRITLGPGCGPGLVARVAEALEQRGAAAVATLVPPDADEADTDVLTAGVGRGRTTSRLAAALADVKGLEVLGVQADVGVVGQVAPDLGLVVAGIGDPVAAETARSRGAVAAILVPGAVSDPAAATRYLDVDG
jgi:orotidine-5'-phosphate decarboxylase